MGPDRDEAAREVFAVASAMQRATDLASLTDALAAGLRPFGLVYCYVAEVTRDSLRVLTGTRNAPLYDKTVSGMFHRMITPLVAVLHRSGPATISELATRPETRDTFARMFENRQRDGYGDGYYAASLMGDGLTYIACFVCGDLEGEGPEQVMGKLLVGSYNACAVRLATGAPKPAGENPLTKRQMDCLLWVRAGKSSTDIGEILGISANTVNEHVAQVCARLGVRTRLQAVTRALELGLFAGPEPS